MRATLESKGWVMYYKCGAPCHKEHYSHPDLAGYEVIVKTKSKTFSILQNNQVIAGPFWGYELEQKLETYAKVG